MIEHEHVQFVEGCFRCDLSRSGMDPDLDQAHVLTVVWNVDNADTFLWTINDCYICGKRLVAGETGFVWGEPFGETMVALKTYCSDECLSLAVGAYFEERHGEPVDYLTIYHEANLADLDADLEGD